MGLVEGQFCWYDLMTTDVDAAKAFYTETIGWSAKDSEGGMPYTHLSIGEQSVGGIMALPEEVKAMGVPPHWLAYIAVDDVDAKAKEVTELGGKILKEATDIPDVGRFAVIADPQGAALALFSPSGDMSPRHSEKRDGDFTWHELNTTDWEAAWAFYEKLFGWTKTSDMDMGPELGTYRMYKQAGDGGESATGGFSNVAKAQGFPPSWLYYITVDDIDAAVKRIESKGGKLTNGPMDVPGGDKIAHLTDPQGGMFAIHWPNPSPKAP